MPSNAGCSKLPPVALAIAMISLGGCATDGSEPGGAVCPPVLPYSRAEQARVAAEVTALPEGALIAEWLADYAVMRAQARACKYAVR